MNVESITDWELLDGAAGSELSDTRLQLHWAAQIPAAVGNSWAAPMEEYAHLTLDWDRAGRALTSKPSAARPSFRVALRLEDMSVHVQDEHGTQRAQRPLAGSTLAAALEWLPQVAAEITGSALDAPLKIPDHELPDHAVAHGAAFDAEPSRLAQLARWYANADRLLRGLASKVNHAGAVRLWPHHFDIATLIRLDPSETGEEARTIGVGLSPGDGSYAEPYWYVTPWPPPPEKRALVEKLPPLDGAGVWHTEDWTGAVLPSSALIDTRDPQEQAGQVLAFTQSAVNAGWALLEPGTDSTPDRAVEGESMSRAEDANTHSVWYKALEPEELSDGRVKSVTCGLVTVCMTHFKGQFAALDNKCPHQGGPLAEGSIENGLLRCPWHGWDYDPISGKAPGFDDGVDTYPIEIRDDGIYVAIEEERPHVRTVTDVMAETLVKWDVRQVFGMVGHSNLGLADALRRQEQAGHLSFYGIRHEGAAAFAASAYGKLTGRPAACFAIAGPGATNLLTGLWDAHVDRAPVIALTGQVNTQVLGPGAFQEVDLAAAFGKVAQWSQTVLSTSKHAELVNLACKSARLNRGVSHLIFPDEVQTLPAAEGAEPGGPEGRMTSRLISPPAHELGKALEMLRKAKRPVIIAGHGARFDCGALAQLADLLHAPVVTTFKGKGLIGDDHPLGCGVLGRSGTPIASWFMNEADCLLVFGASFSDHTGITPKQPTIQVDFDAMALGKSHSVDVPVWGEIGTTIEIMCAELDGGTGSVDQRAEVAERWGIWRAEKQRREQDSGGEGVNSASIFASLGRQVAEDAIMCVDVGNNTYSFGRYFECSHQAVLMSGYLGSIGFGLPAAMGAWAATREDDARFLGRPVVSVSGDGGFGQYMAELLTAVKYEMNITHVLLNNAQLGKISKEQRAGNWHVWQTSLHNPNFAGYAELCGAMGVRVTKAEELDEAIGSALAHKGPALVEVMSDPDLI